MLFVIAFLCWADSGSQRRNPIDLVGVLQQTVFLAVPLILGAMAGVLCERTGVINVAIEGQMLVGAFAGCARCERRQQPRRRHRLRRSWRAACSAPCSRCSRSSTWSTRSSSASCSTCSRSGLTGFLYDALMATASGHLQQPAIISASHQIPVLVDIPVIGKPLFDANYIIYAMYVIVVVDRRRAVPHPLGPAHPRRRRAPEGGRHRRHQGAADPLPQRHHRRHGRRAGGRVPDASGRRAVRQEPGA